MSELIYEPIPNLDRDEIEAAIRRDNPDELLIAVLSAALYADDRDYAKETCLKLATHPHFNVRGNAVLGFGHIARIDGRLDEVRVKPLILAALKDENEYVRGQADAAKDDVEFFLGWTL